ncbi:MAG: GNAT family N-acetyltransferase [Spirochaetales bacterium]
MADQNRVSEYSIAPIQTIEDVTKTKAVATRAFGPGVSLMLAGKRKWGYYAHKKKDVVGGVLLETMSPTEGLLSWIFVDPEAQGHRLGARLLETGVQALDDKGLKTQFALVRADNTASWNMFAKNGYTRPSVLRSLFGYSLKGFPKRFLYSLGTGYGTWVRDDALPDSSMHPRKGALLKTLLFSLFIGAALSLFSLRGTEFFWIGTAMVAGITALRLLVAYPIARTSGPVRFDAPQGGTPLSLILALALGTWWPTFGFFVPKQDIWRDKEFARYNGLQAFATWMSLLLVYVAARLLLPVAFSSGLATVLDLVIIYQVIPFYPFDGMDGARVLRYSRGLYAVGAVLSVAAIILV